MVLAYINIDWQGLLMSIDPYLYPGLSTFLIDNWWLLRFLIQYIIVKFVCVILNELLTKDDVVAIRNEQKTVYVKIMTGMISILPDILERCNVQVVKFQQSLRDRILNWAGYSIIGVTYLRLDLKGSEADIQMAVTSIQELVGIDNVEVQPPLNNNRQITIDDNHIGTYKKTLYVRGSAGGKLRRARDMVDGKGFKINIEINEYADGAGKFLRDMFGRDKEEWYERITALNGVKFIPVYLKGSDEDMKKAVALIYQLVGRVNVEEAIESEYQTTIEEGTTVYIKAHARRNLKIGTIIKKTPVYSIDAERSTVKASNGETYVLVHIKGSEETIQKAIALIQKDVGMDNVKETIELPVDPDTDIVDRRASSVCQSKTLYVKSSTVQRNLHLLDGKEIISKSGLESLRFERESNRSLIMKEIKTSNGMNYVAVHLKGSEEAMRKAIHRMKEVVGNNNVKDEIDMLPDPPVDIPKATSSDNISVEEDDDYDDENRFSLSPVSALVFSTYMLYMYFPDKAELLVLSGTLVILALALYQLIRHRFQLYQAKRTEQTIYVEASQSKCITGKQGRRKRKGIVDKSGVEVIHIDTLSDSDDYLSVHVVGSRKAVQKAIVLIQETVGIENVEFDLEEDNEDMEEDEYVSISTDQPPDDPQTQDKEETVPPNDQLQVAKLVHEKEDRCETEDVESNTPVSETANDNSLVKEEVTASEPLVPLNDQLHAMTEEVPSELIGNSTRGIACETTTEALISSIDDGSKASTTLSSFDMNGDDPLLTFLRSQHQCIKGSVDDFYTWLVKSEDIDSMVALKEAVNEDEYLNTKIKNGNGSSGLKGFKIPPFKRAVLAYDNTKATKDDKEHQLTSEPPDELVCPISLTLMSNDPVVAADGITYERASIEDWFKKSEVEKGSVIYSPVHGTEMKSLILTPHIGTRNMARAFKDEK